MVMAHRVNPGKKCGCYIDIGFTSFHIFTTGNFVPDKREHAENPAPCFHKKIGNGNSVLTEESRQDNARQKQEHEYGKH
ncbi:MAG: hypothetical protein KIT62_02560 [Cyclobacteriaceae bacterium]|nr:hypothetical protein [Cyclobacteriaceae bacterium]